jgi:hypothetical protein
MKTRNSWSIWKKKGYLFLTMLFFLISIILHWIFAWKAYVDDQKAHNQPIQVSGYVNETLRDTMENWQSEFLQLMWQVAGLAAFLYVGSPSSKEGDERKEAKLDYIIKKLETRDADKILSDFEKKYPKN